MKKYLKNDQGYTLLVALGLMMMLMIFMFSFTRIAVSQKVQIEQTDSTLVTTALAEMGAEYYEKMFQQEISKRITTLDTDITAILNGTITFSTPDLMKNKVTTANNELLNFYGGFIVNPTIHSPLVTTVGNAQTGYKLTEATPMVNGEIHMTFVGFVDGEDGQPLSTTIRVPEKLMWEDADGEPIILSFEFDEYSKLGSSYVTILDTDIIENYNNGYPFTSGQFYYFDESSTTFGDNQFNEATATELNGVFVYSPGDVIFSKHTKFTNTQLLTSSLNFTFTSTAQLSITNKSKIITKEITVSNVKQGAVFENSSICYEDHFSNYPTGTPKFEADLTKLNTFRGMLEFANNARIYFRESGDLRYYDSKTGLSKAATQEEWSAACNVTRNYSFGLYETYDPSAVELTSVDYN